MSEVFIVGVDLAKRVFQVHGAAITNDVLLRKQSSRAQVAKLLGDLPACIIAIEACASPYYLGRESQMASDELRLILAAFVKRSGKRHKNDVAYAEAISEKALIPTMRFVALKTPKQQSANRSLRSISKSRYMPGLRNM